MTYNPGSFGHCLVFLTMKFSKFFKDESNEDVVVPLMFDHNSLIVQ